MEAEALQQFGRAAELPHRWRLEQAEEAYRLFDAQTTGKAVILPS